MYAIRSYYVIVHETLDEQSIARALELGAEDAVTLASLDRFRLVIDRELKALKVQRSLKATVTVAGEYQRQLNDLMQGSADAIAQVKEGIIVDANPAWLELFGQDSAEALVGTPLMRNNFV